MKLVKFYPWIFEKGLITDSPPWNTSVHTIISRAHIENKIEYQLIGHHCSIPNQWSFTYSKYKYYLYCYLQRKNCIETMYVY